MCGFPGVVLAFRSGFSTLPLTIIGVVLASMLTTGGVGAAAATLTPIAVSFVTPVPGAPGVTFGVYPTPPAFDGQRVVFASQLPSTAFRGLWSAAPDGSGLLSLADDGTPIPGGSGTFGNVFPFRIGNGLVVFFGNDDATQRGYYSVPTTGGPVTLLVNNSTPIPGGTTNFDVNFQSSFDADGGSVVFEDRGSIYAVPAAGGAASLVGGGVFICEPNYLGGGVGSFHSPDLSGGTVVILASFGQGLIFTAPLSGLTSSVEMCPGQGTVPVATNATRVATLNTVVPGDPQGRTFDSTEFRLPVIDGGTVIFGGQALNSSTPGIFSWRGGTLTRLVDTNTPVPGGTGTFQPLNGGRNYTTSNDQVVFRGIDAAGKTGLYLVSAAGGAIVKIIAQGDPLDGGRTVAELPQEAIGPSSFSGSKLTFIVNVVDPTVGLTKAVYIADLSASPCGVERWPVKTGTDPDAQLVNLGSVTPTTVQVMRSWAPPATLPEDSRIAPVETTVWVIDGLLTLYKKDDDSDYHLVLQDLRGNTMVTKIPSPGCVEASSPFAAAIATARSQVDSHLSVTTAFQTANIPVRMTGVGFFESPQGGPGVAPNGIELHPILDVQFNVGLGASGPGLGDFNGDGKTDIFWLHTSGVTYSWLMNGASIANLGSPGAVPAGWSVAGIGDFNGDGKADILWRHTSGAIVIWLMNGTAVVSVAVVGSVASDWAIAGVGDFNGDGKADILWRHSSGVVYVWLMDGTTVIGTGSPGSVPSDWTIVGVADFNGDGYGDILWRHSSGVVYTWLMNGTSIAGAGSPGSPSADWTIQGVGDFNGDGKADILWRHSSGVVYIWLMNGTSVSNVGSPGSVGTEWTIQGVGDFDGDGKADILWRHSSGVVYLWLMDGISSSGTGSPGSVDPSWTIQ